MSLKKGSSGNDIESAIGLLSVHQDHSNVVEPLIVYRNACIIDDASISDTSYDQQALEALELSLSKLNSEKNRYEFLDAWKRYIRLLLKYKKWLDADNFLKVYQSKQTTSDMPAWHMNATAKVIFELNPRDSLTNPEEIFSLIHTAVTCPKGIHQAKSVFKEFIHRAQNFLETSELDRVQYDTFVEKARRFASDTSDTELVDWTNINILDTKEYDKKSNIKVVSDDLLIQDLRNKIEAYESEIEKLHNEIVVLHSKNEELHSIVENNKKTSDTLSTNIETPVEAYRKLKILVLGASTIKPKDIIGIAKRHGLTKHNLQLELDYSKNKRFDLTALRYTSPYSGILVGPVAHKITGLGDHSSILGLLQEEGFPPHVAIKTNSGTLKITKTAISTAFDNIMNQIGSYDPDFIPTV